MKNKLILTALLIILTAGCISSSYIDRINYAGQTLHFRANLIEAEKVPVIPSQDYINAYLLSPDLRNIKISYIPNSTKVQAGENAITENDFYFANAYGLAYHLTIFYKSIYGTEQSPSGKSEKGSCFLVAEGQKEFCIESHPLNTTEEIKNQKGEVTILLLGPSQASETSISFDNEKDIIIVQGKEFYAGENKYTDLDLAVDKLLITLLGWSSGK